MYQVWWKCKRGANLCVNLIGMELPEVTKKLQQHTLPLLASKSTVLTSKFAGQHC